MQVIIDLESNDILSVEQLSNSVCISTMVFSFVVDQHLDEKMKHIFKYVPVIAKSPLIKTVLKVKSIQTTPVNQFSTIALGGTFDYLHLGHQFLLLYGALAAKQTMYIGVTGDKLLERKKNKQIIQPISVRMKEVEDFIKSIKPDLKLIIFELQDPFGPTIDHEDIECLVASPETASSVMKINQIRAQNKLKDLQLVLCPLLSPNQDLDLKISSSAIREFILKKNGFKISQVEQYKKYYNKLIESIDAFCKYKPKTEESHLWWDTIFRSYSECWRHYHTNQHILNIFRSWNSQKYQKQRSELIQKKRIMVELALFFHDIVYVPSSKTNEKDSAAISGKFIQTYFEAHPQKQEIKETVSRLIEETQNHVPSSKLSQIVYNLDMEILNCDKGHYKEYATKIKKEYLPIVKEEYNQKRMQFLKKLFQQKLYFTFEHEHVKSNIQWQIFCLQNDDL